MKFCSAFSQNPGFLTLFWSGIEEFRPTRAHRQRLSNRNWKLKVMYIHKTLGKSWEGWCLGRSYFSIYSGFGELNQHQEHLTLVKTSNPPFLEDKKTTKIHPAGGWSCLRHPINLIPIFCLSLCMLAYAFPSLCTPLLFNV